MKISAEKTKLITNSASDSQREVKVKGQKLGIVTSFKYLTVVVSDNGSRLAKPIAALTKLKKLTWRDYNTFIGSKVKLMRCLIIYISLYACESWVFRERTQAFEMRYYRGL